MLRANTGRSLKTALLVATKSGESGSIEDNACEVPLVSADVSLSSSFILGVIDTVGVSTPRRRTCVRLTRPKSACRGVVFHHVSYQNIGTGLSVELRQISRAELDFAMLILSTCRGAGPHTCITHYIGESVGWSRAGAYTKVGRLETDVSEFRQRKVRVGSGGAAPTCTDPTP